MTSYKKPSNILSSSIEQMEDNLRRFLDETMTYEYGNWEQDVKHLKMDLKLELLDRKNEEERLLGDNHTTSGQRYLPNSF